MKKNNIICIILAGGKGKRIKFSKSKILLKINKKTLIQHAIELAEKYSNNINVIINKKLIFIKEKYKKKKFLLQTKSLGTGHALMTFFNKNKYKNKYFLILYADTPFIKKSNLDIMIKKIKTNDLVFLAFFSKSNKDCGLIKTNRQGKLEKIIEYKNANESEKKINLCNSGVLLMNFKSLRLIKKIKENKLTKEYYLTDLIKICKDRKLKINYITTKDEIGSRGINDLKNFKRSYYYFKNRMI